jgi:hypothetical protein
VYFSIKPSTGHSTFPNNALEILARFPAEQDFLRRRRQFPFPSPASVSLAIFSEYCRCNLQTNTELLLRIFMMIFVFERREEDSPLMKFSLRIVIRV